MTKNIELTVEEKLQNLFGLQSIDSQIDEIKVLRGELPMEVNDLEDEITGLQSRVSKLEDEIKGLQQSISDNENGISAAKALVEKYEGQQGNVKNNREFDALTKEIELQNLEVQLSEKKIRDANTEIKGKEEYLTTSQEKLSTREADLVRKKLELEEIVAKTEKDEAKLTKKSTSQQKKIEDRLLVAYHRIRNNYRNGLAVVTIERDSCGGCFAKIPPQRQLEIRQRKRLILCEHCGRVLVDNEIAGAE